MEISVLSCLANSQEERPITSDWTEKMFYCPPEMLDGRLFNKTPNSIFNDSHGILDKFHFHSFPGSHLPLTYKFFQHYGFEIEDKQQSPIKQECLQDQGYSSLPDVDWLEVAKMPPLPACHTWEQLGQLVPEPELPLFHEYCYVSTRDSSNCVSLEQLYRDLQFLAVGISSVCFPFNEEESNFEVAPNLSVTGLSIDIIKKWVTPLLEYGNNHRQLEMYVAIKYPEDGCLAKALRQAVRHFLILHSEATHRILMRKYLGIPQLVQSIRWFAPPLSLVAQLSRDSQNHSGIEILEHLCSTACVLPPGRSAYAVYYLLKSVASIYFRILGNWLFEGDVDAEGASEFFVQLQPEFLELRTRQFWTQGFVMLENRVPKFLHGFEDALMLCGKAVCLLKLCNPKEPLVCELREEIPNLECCLQPSELAELQNKWEAYLIRACHVCGPAVSAALQLERSQEQQQAFLAMVTKVQQERLAQIRASQKIEREAKWQAQLKLQAELRQQMIEVKARKAMLLRQEQEEEEQRQLVVEAQHAEQDRRVAEEREKILDHYKELSAASERKLEKANRRIEELKNELCQEKSDENSNPINGPKVTNIETADANANLPTQRQSIFLNIPPSSLLLNTSNQKENIKNSKEREQTQNMTDATTNYKVATSEAERNKSRALMQEINFLSDYNENNETLIDKRLNLPLEQAAARNKAKFLQHECIFNTNENDTKLSNNVRKPLDIKSNLDSDKISVHSSENLISPISSSSSDVISSEKIIGKIAPQCTAMTASMESVPSLKTDIETPTGSYPSDMSVSVETSSIENPPSPCSTVTCAAMTNSKCAEKPSEVPGKPIPTSLSNISFLSALSALNKPFKWSKPHNKENLNTALKKLDISTSHLTRLLHQTVSVVLSTQLKLVNQSILKLFLQDEHLLNHFHSLCQYFLLVDGEFARHITESLCCGMKEHARNPKSLLNFVSLDSILCCALSSSVHGAKDCNAGRLSMAVRSEPTEFKLSETSALNCMQLQYQVVWPLCLIITPDALFHYNTIFVFLLGLRRGLWAVDNCFQWLQQPPSNIKHRALSKSFHYHQLRLFRHEMGNFVRAIHYYIMNVAVLSCWNKFKIHLKRATTLDELYKFHASFIKRVKFFCLLRQEASELQKLLQGVLKTVLKFHRQLTSYEWRSCANGYEHPAMNSLVVTFSQFQERTRLLLRNMTKLADRGYQQELYELLHALNMNDYYGLNLL